ncbi:MAG: MCE family protein [Desulfobacteraceae bacterium]|nr:MCE family protein [Desulfobacteraceae bacterium]
MIPEAEVKKTKFSLIWLIPFAALITGIWIIYDQYSKKGVEITIEFKNGDGITEGKTALKYAGIKIGSVDKIKLNKDFSSVIVTAVIEKQYLHFAKKNSLFWLVKPRLEVGAISGVETIFTGQYIAVRPGHGEKHFSFKALENPPPSAENAPGLHLVLKSKTFSGLVPGSPVLYKKIKVGKVEAHSLSKNKDEVLIKILINPEYSMLVKKDTRFWNVSGFEISGDLSGVKIKADSFASVLDGGIAFDTPENNFKSPQLAENKDEFILYNNRENAMERGFPIKITFETGEGLIPNSTPLKYKGITIGKVSDIDIDKTTGKIIATVRLKENAKNAATENSKFWMVRPRLDIKGISGLSTIISGQYIEIQPAPGNPATEFKALSEPPFTDPNSPGLHIILKAKSKGSFSEGSPVYTRGIEAGRVEGYELSKDGVNISVHIFEKYCDLIFEGTRFWSESGIKIKGDLTGIDIQTGSLQSFVTGSIAFDTPFDKKTNACSGDIFTLFPDKEKASRTEKNITIIFDNADNLKKGTTPLKYKGMVIGKVTDVKYTANMEKIAAEVSLFANSPDISKKGSIFFLVTPQISPRGITGLETILSGAYINTFIGSGGYSNEFHALNTPPADHPDMKGKKIIIKTKKDNSFRQGTPIFYGSIEAGMITKTSLLSGNENIDMEALIYNDFKDLVSSKTKFFNISGINIKADLFEVELQSRNLSTIINGGIEFENIEDDSPKSDKKIFELYQSRQKALEKGFSVSLHLSDSYGIKENHTKIIYKGLTIGRIEKIRFNEHNKNFTAKAFIINEALNLIKESSKFYLRSAGFDFGKVKYPETILTGKFIELVEGKGAFKNEFTLLEKEDIKGLEIILESDNLGSLSIGKPVFYRQIKIGEITGFELNQTFDKVLIYAVIQEKYSEIVRENTKFWYTGGVAAKINLFGVKIKTGTLESILKGGIALATPDNDNMGEKAQNKAVFNLYENPEEKWLEWRPSIQ